MFDYGFMQRALWVGLLIALMAPLVGQTLVLRRLSMVSDAIAHVTLAGIAIGLLLGIPPLLSALLTSLIGVFIVEFLRKRLPDYSEVAVAILMALGIGLAGSLSSWVKDGAQFNSFLFGSIVATTPSEVLWMSGVAILVIGLYLVFYKEIFALTFDEDMASYMGLPVKWINFMFMGLLSLVLSIAAKTVGSLILSSLLVLPVATALQIAKSYKSTLVWALVFSVASMLCGLTVSFYFGLKPGGAVVLFSVLFYLLVSPLKGLKSHGMAPSA